MVASHEPLLHVSITQAEAAGLDEIRISVPRARMIRNDLLALKKALSDEGLKASRSTAHFNRLDQIFFEQSRVMNEAMSKMGL